MERFKQIVTLSLILINDKKQVLLQKRYNTGYMDGMYALVSGHLENDESMLQGIIREANEEVGIELESENVDFVCLIRSGNDGYINSYFKSESFQGDVVNMEPEKCSELTWFDINNIPENIIPNDKRAIYNMLNNITLDEYDFKTKKYSIENDSTEIKTRKI